MTGIYRLVVRVLIVSMAWLPFSTQAALVGTGEIVAGAQQAGSRDKVVEFLGRAEVAQQLQAMGLTADTAKARVAALTPDEVDRLAGQIDSLPAGASDAWVWAAIVIAIVVYLVWYKR